jgi:dihydrofolate reductase
MNHVTLDGVMQSPGRVDEDTRGGFTHGGWGALVGDEAAGEAFGTAMRERMEDGGGLRGWLFGRRTYEDLLSYWNRQPDRPFGPMLNSTSKYVVSNTLKEPLPWPNSTLLLGDIADSVAALKAQSGGVLGIMGSGKLIEALLRHNLIDEFLLMIHPLVLGSGHRLFPEGAFARLRLVDSVPTPSGALIVTYQPIDAAVADGIPTGESSVSRGKASAARER